jgi:hypothetical protein
MHSIGMISEETRPHANSLAEEALNLFGSCAPQRAQ